MPFSFGGVGEATGQKSYYNLCVCNMPVNGEDGTELPMLANVSKSALLVASLCDCASFHGKPDLSDVVASFQPPRRLMLALRTWYVAFIILFCNCFGCLG